MGTAIEYQKLMTEIVYINLPGPEEPMPNIMAGTQSQSQQVTAQAPAMGQMMQ